MDAEHDATHRGLIQRVGALVDSFETVIYAIAFLLLVSAAVLVVIGGAEAVVQAASHKVNTLQSGVLVLDRVLMVLIIAEIAATLRAVLLYHEIAAEPFLFIGLIACVRRILIVTAQSEQVHSDKELDRLLLELGALGLLVIGIAAAIFMLRYSARRAAPTHGDDG
ncbi:MAG: phosphate-starvation-inducible PsiE family protein [Mycobacterium sp.]|uniref:phosphate-starvation-inducible PsiE family protein n=1 Tax=Mycobacterium sp. TaxID=1785 RepID=UPI003BB61091